MNLDERPQTANEEQPSPPAKGLKERLYDRVRLPLWAIDGTIGLLVLALIVTIILGTR